MGLFLLFAFPMLNQFSGKICSRVIDGVNMFVDGAYRTVLPVLYFLGLFTLPLVEVDGFSGSSLVDCSSLRCSRHCMHKNTGRGIVGRPSAARWPLCRTVLQRSHTPFRFNIASCQPAISIPCIGWVAEGASCSGPDAFACPGNALLIWTLSGTTPSTRSKV